MACMILYPAILAFILLSIPLFLFTLAINEIGHLIFKIPKKEM
jgi:hypothetical protein